MITVAMVRSWGVNTAAVAMVSKQLSTGSAAALAAASVAESATASECNQFELAGILAVASIAFVAIELAEQR